MLIWIAVVFFLAAPAHLTAQDDVGLISTGPQSRNVTEGTTVVVNCVTPYSLSDITMNLDLFTMGVERTDVTLNFIETPDGGTEVRTMLVATAGKNETTAVCAVFNKTQPSQIEVEEGLLLVQGPPAGVSEWRLVYENVCCTRIAWDDPYTLSGVPITGYNITVDGTTVSPDNGALNNTPCLSGPGSYVVSVRAFIDSEPGTTAQFVADIPEGILDLTVQQVPEFVHFTVLIPQECGIPINFTIMLKELSANIDEFTVSVTQTSNGQITASRTLEDLSNRRIQATGFVTFTDGTIITTEPNDFSTFDIQTTSGYSVSSEGVVCVECELVPGTQAQGCRVELDCDNGDHFEQDIVTSNLPTANRCLPSASTTPTFCTLSFFDIEEDDSVSSNPALTFDVLIPGMVLPSEIVTTGIVATSTPGFSTTVIITVVVIALVVLILLIVVCALSIYWCIIIRRRKKKSGLNDQQRNMYQLPEQTNSQGLLTSSLQYAEVDTPASGGVVLPVENNSVSYSSVDFERLGVTSTDSMMDHKQLMCFVAPRVAGKWYHVGVALALTPPFLEDIEQNCGGNPERCISDVFQAWREQRSRPYTWESLLISLRAVGVEEMEFASELELQVESLQQQRQQQSMVATNLQPPVEGYSRLQHNSNQPTPSVTPCRHLPPTGSFGSIPQASNNATLAPTATVTLIEPGMTLDQLVGELTNKFASKWKEVGVALVLTPPSLESIATRNCQEPTMCMTGVVQLWKHCEPRPYALRTLITVLKSIGEHNYATQLENYQIAGTT